MSKRRKIGDSVWVPPGEGFGASRGEWATIPDTSANQEEDICFLCGDDDCREWADVWPLGDDNKRTFYHISECRMFDEPQECE
jgi:hypothetical protein